MYRIEEILRRQIGLDATSIGSSVIERTLRSRMKQHGLKHAEDYSRLLAESPEELSALVEAIVVTETWFMRGREAFAAFADLAINGWLPRNPSGVMRVLSLPCSSGEEPYSMVMELLDAGMPADRFAVDAVDISSNALARAENAIYGKNSFRGKLLEFRDKYFVPVKHSLSPLQTTPLTHSVLGEGGEGGRGTHLEEGYALSPDIQRRVTFQRDNLLRDGFKPNVRYDFIFCRNLLIYFDRATQGVALNKIRTMLAPGGVLFVGPAEMPIVTEYGFENAKISHAFASRMVEVKSGNAETKGQRSNASRPASNPGLPEATSWEMDRAVSPLFIARQLADAGQLADAEKLCRKHLEADDTCAEGYYLLGLVKDAANDPEAITYYRKAIYLEPNHYEALVHAALWLEKNGDAIRAEAFKRRAERQLKNQNQGVPQI